MTGACAQAPPALLLGRQLARYFHFHNPPPPAIIASMDELVEIKVRADEAEFLSDPARCDVCGHLERLRTQSTTTTTMNYVARSTKRSALYRPSKIISGGQTGADMGGLLAGRDLGIKTGGWAPKGWVTENGPDYELRNYGLVQHSSPNYPPRTRMNCQDSDLTVIFGDLTSAGTRLTIKLCQEDSIPYLLNPDATELRTICEYLQVETLNVAGNRASKDAGIEDRVRKVIVEAFRENN